MLSLSKYLPGFKEETLRQAQGDIQSGRNRNTSAFNACFCEEADIRYSVARRERNVRTSSPVAVSTGLLRKNLANLQPQPRYVSSVRHW
jgi:hypothetical protein